MSLNLSVPAFDENPAIPAEAGTKQIQELIANLPSDVPWEAAGVLVGQLSALNRQPVSSDARLKAMELYRPAVAEITQGLSRHYCNQPLPLSDTAIKAARAAKELHGELAYGYKHAILAEENKLFSLGGEKQTALLVQRAMEALGNMLLAVYQGYSGAPAGVWAEMHQLYLYSLRQSLQDIEVDTGHSSSTINLGYKRALLLALADPHNLDSTDIGRVVDYLKRFAGHTQLRPFGKTESPVGIYLVRLNQDKPPVPLTKRSGSINIRTDILLITVNLARLLHQQITMLQANEPPTNLDLPEGARDPRYQDLLAHLLKQWGKPPSRLFNRVESKGVVAMCAGLPAIHHFLSGKAGEATPEVEEPEEISLDLADSPIDSGGSTFRQARWMMVNESAGGMALTKLAEAQVELRVGELLGLRTNSSRQWSLAALRWALGSDHTPLGIGAQLLAPSAQPVMVRPAQQQFAGKALLLPDMPALNQPATLITAPGTYSPARELLLDEQGKETRLLATRLVERTASFERFQFSRI